jgi:macrodomain Ter protein organizer (MatP/YcbG family)
MTSTIRKNFVFDVNIAMHLEELAKETKKSMTALVQEMIEDRYKTVKAKKRVQALNEIDDTFSGSIGNKTIQDIKAEKIV